MKSVGVARGSWRIRCAFTLIEVLVVVAIIALLVAILLPSLSRVRWQAKSTACKANLHDLGQAFTMYADQYRGFYPVSHHPYIDNLHSVWDARLLRNPQILACPGTRNVVRLETLRKPKSASDYAASVVPEDQGRMFVYIPSSDINHPAANALDSRGGHSYEYISIYGDQVAHKRSAMANRRRRSTHYIFPPAEMLLVHDQDEPPSTNGALGCSGSVGVLQGSNAGNNCPQPWDNHGSEGMNMMFADGHAQFTKKVAGEYRDYTVQPVATRYNENASIDQLWLKATQPWLFKP